MMTEFHLFPNLPTELRLMIWEICLPSRIFELECPVPRDIGPNDCILYWPTRQNWQPPVLARVCRESRTVALENGFVDNMRYCPRWFCPTRDIPVQWTLPADIPDFGIQDDTYLTLDPFHYADELDTKRPIGLSARRVLELYPKPVPPGLSPAYMDWDLFEKNRRDTYFVMVQAVTIHVSAELGRQSGPFGLLGDEHIQLVAATDDDTIFEYLSLWESAPGPRQKHTEAGYFFL